MEFEDLPIVGRFFRKDQQRSTPVPPPPVGESNLARQFREAEAKRQQTLEEVKNGPSSTNTNAVGTQGKP